MKPMHLQNNLMKKTIDYYHFLISPWSYLAINRFNALVEKHNVTVNYIPIDVMPTFDAMGGVPPGKRHPSRQRLRMDELKRWSTYLNLEMNLQPAFFPANVSLASKMLIAGNNQNSAMGSLGSFSDAVLTAVWRGEQNIADRETLITLANQCELDGVSLANIADSDALADQFAALTQSAHEKDVFGSPTYIYENEIFWGQDRLDFLDRALSD